MIFGWFLQDAKQTKLFQALPPVLHIQLNRIDSVMTYGSKVLLNEVGEAAVIAVYAESMNLSCPNLSKNYGCPLLL